MKQLLKNNLCLVVAFLEKKQQQQKTYGIYISV